MKIFVDTSAFIALEDRSDVLHPRAKRFYETLTSADRLLTSNYVVDETITRLRYCVGCEAALAFADIILKSRLCSISYVDADLERAALQVMSRYKDKRLSFTDCVSMALMAELKADAVFAFDEDFAKAGFRMVPGA
ncbi:MAG: PIN domain-containing protein [Elusimicrobia bacterium]|nr:PIN domain-containing protein [Elusimicrobiota bacterium]